MISPQKASAQLRVLIQLTQEALEHVLYGRGPADRFLANRFQQHHEWGSRDRRLLRHGVFAVFRWWGCLRMIAPQEPWTTTPPEAWHPLLADALLAEDDTPACVPEPLLALLDPSGALQQITHPLPDPWSRILACMKTQSPDAAPPAPECLIPGWAIAEITCPRTMPELITWLQKRPPLWLRAQRRPRRDILPELEQAGLHLAPHPLFENAMSARGAVATLQGHPCHRNGDIEIQDLGSQAVGQVCAPQPGQTWLDACAGAGGKTLLLAQLMQDRGSVFAWDTRPHMLTELQQRAHRAGLHCISTDSPGQQRFDGVLVDAPCSGSGTWRRNADARWSLQPEAVAAFAATQYQLLDEAASRVKPGGRLVYATCSMFKRENEDTMQAFLNRRADFELDPFPHPLIPAKEPAGSCTLWPWEGDQDIFFAARFRRVK